MIRKILKYYVFVGLVSLLVLKYRILLFCLTDKAIIRALEKRFHVLKNREALFSSGLPAHLIIKRVNLVFKRLFPQAKCLIKSIVQNEILMLYGFKDQKIKLGVKYEEDKLLAHAWVIRGNGFKSVHEL